MKSGEKTKLQNSLTEPICGTHYEDRFNVLRPIEFSQQLVNDSC